MLEDLCEAAVSIKFKSQDGQISDRLSISQSQCQFSPQKPSKTFSVKCFKCYNQNIYNCLQCKGQQKVSSNHPLAELLGQILNRKMTQLTTKSSCLNDFYRNYENRDARDMQYERVCPSIKEEQEDIDEKKEQMDDFGGVNSSIVYEYRTSHCQKYRYSNTKTIEIETKKQYEKKTSNPSIETHLLSQKMFINTLNIEKGSICNDNNTNINILQCNNCISNIQGYYSLCKNCENLNEKYILCDQCSDSNTHNHHPQHKFKTLLHHNHNTNYNDRIIDHNEAVLNDMCCLDFEQFTNEIESQEEQTSSESSSIQSNPHSNSNSIKSNSIEMFREISRSNQSYNETSQQQKNKEDCIVNCVTQSVNMNERQSHNRNSYVGICLQECQQYQILNEKLNYGNSNKINEEKRSHISNVSRVRFQLVDNLFSSDNMSSNNQKNIFKSQEGSNSQQAMKQSLNVFHRRTIKRKSTMVQSKQNQTSLIVNKNIRRLESNKNFSYFKEENFKQSIKSQSDYKFEGYQCDICKISPIINIRHHCQSCQNYDLCQSCYNAVDNDHDFTHNFILIDGRLLRQNKYKEVVFMDKYINVVEERENNSLGVQSYLTEMKRPKMGLNGDFMKRSCQDSQKKKNIVGSNNKKKTRVSLMPEFHI